MHCLNPDRVVMRGGVLEACAGAIADLYEQIGGRVTWYGKPHEMIYRHALHLAGDPSAGAVLAVGDGLLTDMLGAVREGFDAIFVSGGIHAGEPFPPDFAQDYSLGEWSPVAVVEGPRLADRGPWRTHGRLEPGSAQRSPVTFLRGRH